MNNIIYIALILVAGYLMYRAQVNRHRFRNQSEDMTEMPMDELTERKRLFNESRKPGELDNSVEIPYYPSRTQDTNSDQ